MPRDSWYCYAITRRPPALDGVRGVAGTPLETVAEAGLVAVVSPVPADEFSEAALRATLEDLDRLAELARRHHEVVAEVVEAAPALPCRLATVYLDRRGVADMLREGAPEFTAALARIEGSVEWGVKVYADAEPAQAPAAAPSGSPGRSYLRRRMSARQAADDAWRDAADAADEVDRALRELAGDATRHRPQSRELSGAEGHNVLNAAYLVRHEDVDRFLATVDDLRTGSPGCRVEVTGPWAPYSFVPEGS